MTKDNHSIRASQSFTAYFIISLGVLCASGVGLWWRNSNHIHAPTLNEPASARSPSLDTSLLSKKTNELTEGDEASSAQALTDEQRVDQAWRVLGEIDFARLIPSPNVSFTRNQALGLLGGPLSRWRARAAREGFIVGDYGGRPTLKSGPVRITLRVREGFIIGAELDFDQERGVAAGPEWSRAVMILAGPTLIGGPHDPMMTLDALTAPSVVQSHQAQDLNTSQPDALSGVWPATSSRVAISYHLALSDEGTPLRARLWLTPREAP